MSNLMKLAIAFGAGALVMYMFDPVTGRRRRALAHDRALGESLDAAQFTQARAQRVADRIRGAAVEAQARTSTDPVDDERLYARIQSKLGHLVERPADVQVEVLDSCAMLSGRVKASELPGLIAGISAIPGVEDVQSRLKVGRARAATSTEQVSRH